MFKFIFKFAIRHFLRNKFYTIINISGLSIGLACTLAILLWVKDERSYDMFHSNIDNLYRVVENQYYSGGEIFPVAVTPSPLAKNLKDEYPEITHATRFKNSFSVIENDGQTFTESSAFVDRDFFEMFSVDFIEGNKEISFNDLNSVVLTKKLAEKYKNVHIAVFDNGGETFYRVRVGLAHSLEQADAYEKLLIQDGFEDVFVVAE